MPSWMNTRICPRVCGPKLSAQHWRTFEAAPYSSVLRKVVTTSTTSSRPRLKTRTGLSSISPCTTTRSFRKTSAKNWQWSTPEGAKTCMNRKLKLSSSQRAGNYSDKTSSQLSTSALPTGIWTHSLPWTWPVSNPIPTGRTKSAVWTILPSLLCQSMIGATGSSTTLSTESGMYVRQHSGSYRPLVSIRYR